MKSEGTSQQGKKLYGIPREIAKVLLQGVNFKTIVYKKTMHTVKEIIVRKLLYDSEKGDCTFFLSREALENIKEYRSTNTFDDIDEKDRSILFFGYISRWLDRDDNYVREDWLFVMKQWNEDLYQLVGCMNDSFSFYYTEREVIDATEKFSRKHPKLRINLSEKDCIKMSFSQVVYIQ